MYQFASVDLEEQISSMAIDTVAISALALFIFTILSVLVIRKGSPKVQKVLKLPLFLLMSATMVLSTLFLIGSTVYLNVNSDSGGPVHWHAGIEFWTCDTELNLRDPIGFLSNKVGSATFHEHNDKYIHLEGVVVDRDYDASLEKFMVVTGGYITDNSIGIPLTDDESKWPVTGDQLDGDNIGNTDETSFQVITDNGNRIADSKDGPVLELRNGDACGENGTEPGELQVFVYTYNKDDDTYSQQKIEDPGSYIMRDESTLGPPGDCVIVEFDTPKAATDRLCEQYGIKDVERCVSFGVSEFNPGLCNIREVNKPADPPAEPIVEELTETTELQPPTVEELPSEPIETEATTNPEQPVQMEATQ